MDIWCGTWRICEEILQKTNSIYACDFSPVSIDVFQKKKILPEKNIFMHAITTTIPFKNDTFDVITSCQVIQHLYLDDLLFSLSELTRVLKQWWIIVASTYNFNHFGFSVFEEIFTNGLYAKRFTPAYIKYLAKQNGLTVKYIWYYSVNPILHWGNNKVNMLLEYILSSIPFVNKYLWKYLFFVLQK